MPFHPTEKNVLIYIAFPYGIVLMRNGGRRIGGTLACPTGNRQQTQTHQPCTGYETNKRPVNTGRKGMMMRMTHGFSFF